MLYENDVKNTSSRQRLDFKLVKDHIESYVMSIISVQSTNPIELEKLCLLKSKIAEIELLFQMMEKHYRLQIINSSISDNLFPSF